MRDLFHHHISLPDLRLAVLKVLVTFVLITAVIGSMPATEVILLDGKAHPQEILRFTDQHILLADQAEPIPWTEVDQIRLGNSSDVRSEPAPSTMVLLKDGSYIGVEALNGIKNGLQVASTYGLLDLPLGVLVAWGEPSWIESKRNEPIDIVQLDGSEISGSIQGISEGKVLIKSDLSPDPIPLPLAGVLGVHLAIPVERPRGIHLSTQASSQIPPVILVPTESGFVLQSLPKQRISSDQITQLTVHGGRRVFLSDLQPSLVNEEGAFGVVWNYSVNKNIDGSPLVLGGKRHNSGLVIHSKAELEWKLNAQFTTFSCVLGIVDLMGREGDCSVRILGDGAVLWEATSIRGADKPRMLQLAVDGLQILRVEIGYGARYDIGDHLALANAWLLKK